MEPMIAIWSESSRNHSNLWMFYIVIVTAVAGFSLTTSSLVAGASNSWAAYAILVALAVFMVVNAISIWNNLATYEAARQGLITLSETEIHLRLVVDSINEIPRFLVIAVHGVLDILVLSAVASRI